MGDVNQYSFVEQIKQRLKGPYLEVGALGYGSSHVLRNLFPGEPYMGVDMAPGAGVDLVLDMTGPFDEIEKSLDKQRFKSIFCLSVLEHCAKPHRMAKNMTRLLAKDGVIVVSVPFAWKFHGYPSDYWRFTHEGVKQLFPGINFDNEISHFSTSYPGERLSLDLKNMRINTKNPGRLFKEGRLWRGIELFTIRLLGKVGILHWLTRYRYLMAPMLINMVGFHKEQEH